jgi:hypothetical protein
MTNSEWLGGTLLANPSERVGSRPQAQPKDAWELFEGKREQRADDPLADAHAALLRAIAELRAAGIAVPISLHQAVARADVRACESFAMTKRERVRGGRRL